MKNNYSHPFRLGILLWLCLFLSGCANVSIAPVEDDQKAKSFKAPRTGNSTLYLVRNTTWGQAYRLELSVNGLPVAMTAPHTYVKFDLLPGTYLIGSRGDGTQVATSNHMPIVLVEGKTHFVWQRVTIGLLAMETELIELSEADGKAAVLESSMVKKLIEDRYLSPVAAR
jgi:hypothetical protein